MKLDGAKPADGSMLSLGIVVLHRLSGAAFELLYASNIPVAQVLILNNAVDALGIGVILRYKPHAGVYTTLVL